MNDKETIQELLKAIYDSQGVGDVHGMMIRIGLIKDSIDLIYRQKAKIERSNKEIDILIRKNETLKDEVAEQKAEIDGQDVEIMRLKHEVERLKDSNKRLKEAVGLMLNNDNGVELIKSEARKEFWERVRMIILKLALKNTNPNTVPMDLNSLELIDTIDNLINELTKQ